MTRNTLTTTSNAPAGAEGAVRLQDNAQGKSEKQTLSVTLKGLETNTEYTLSAVVGNAAESVPVANFTTDSKGSARISYSGKGKKNALPAILNPLTDVRALSIDNSSTQSVAFAWIDTSDNYQYLVKRNLTPADSSGTAAGQVSLKASANSVNFKLITAGLTASNTYSIALNSNVVSSASADANGRITWTEWPATAPAILDLHLLQVLDGSSNAVLSTQLPQ